MNTGDAGSSCVGDWQMSLHTYYHVEIRDGMKTVALHSVELTKYSMSILSDDDLRYECWLMLLSVEWAQNSIAKLLKTMK